MKWIVMASLFFAGYLGTQGTISAAEDWENPEVIQVNIQKPHATLVAYPDRLSAATFNRQHSTNIKLLNGDWRFHWVPKPADRPMDFFKIDFDDSAWKILTVPSNWEIQGYGTAIYTNSKYPFPKDAPKIPHDDNPVGSYRRTFTAPEAWQGKNVFLTFDGVASAFYLWINGQKVGYSQGSRTPAEWNITKFLKPGENLLAAEVYRWCDGSYLEDQDFWRLSGIFRDVTLHARTKQHVRDFRVVTDLDAQYTDATLTVSAEVVNPDGATLALELFDADGTSIVTEKKAASADETAFTLPVRNPKKWSNESPALYSLFLTLSDKNGTVLEVIPQKVGFREVAIKEGVFTINGVPIKLKGVNRHETHPDMGQVVTRASMMRDITLFKKNNINAVRTSHYPNVPLLYDLCDQYGIWVMDEANIESHGYGTAYRTVTKGKNPIANKPIYKEAHLNRVERMAARDKNHPSIIMWSLGNEAGIGPNHDATYALLRERYPTRPVQYQGDRRPDAPAADLDSMMYAPAPWLSESAKPSILCEYTHAMGNSNGNLKEYWEDNIYKKPRHAGAFVWDWMDQGIRKPVPAAYSDAIGTGPVKETVFAYGGWKQKEYRHDKNFCMNGLLAADWTPHPGLFAIKHVYRNIHVTPVDLAQGIVNLRSWHDYTSLHEIVEGSWRVEENGKAIATGRLSVSDLTIAAHSQKQVKIELPTIALQPGAEYFLTLSFTAKANFSPLVKAGHELTFAQFKLPFKKTAPAIEAKTLPKLKTSEADGSIVVSGTDFSITFDATTGAMSNYTHKGKRLLVRGPALDLWRAYTDNDNIPIKKGLYSDAWRHAVKNQVIDHVELKMLPEGAARLRVSAHLPDVNAAYEQVTTIYGNGEVAVGICLDNKKVPEKLRHPHRVGTVLHVPAGFEQLSWYGRGPHPTYCDRKFERISRYSGTVDEQWIDYARPQENGNKADVRWVSLTDLHGNGLLFRMESAPLSVSARHYSIETMEASDYAFKMRRSANVILNIDHKQLGVGGDTSWGRTAHPPYQLTAKRYEYTYRMRPIVSGQQVEKCLIDVPAAIPVTFGKLSAMLSEMKVPESKKAKKDK